MSRAETSALAPSSKNASHASPTAIMHVALAITAYAVGVYILWAGAVAALHVPAFLIPHPNAVAASLYRLRGYYLHHFATTLYEAGVGVLLGAAGGLFVGFLLRYGRAVGRALNPVVVASQVFPKEALAPLILVYLGFGTTPKIVISAMICFFPVAINTFRGLEAAPPEFRRLMLVYGATPLQRFTRCDLPFAARYILAALRVCATLSVIGAVVGEFVGSSAGLGYVIRSANSEIGTDRIFAALILLGAIGAAFYGSAVFLDRVLFRRFTTFIQ